MKRYFLGLAAGYSTREVWQHTFGVADRNDIWKLEKYLGKRYGGEAIACKNGRGALYLALKAYFEPGDAIIVNGFTCYAVYEAVVAARMKPVFADISREDLNFDLEKLEKSDAFHSGHTQGRSPELMVPSKTSSDFSKIRGIIIQNSLGNPVDIAAVEKFAKKHGLTIIEDLAHCAGVKYPDGREVGTVGAATALSFGKEKAVDAVSGGAVVMRAPCKHMVEAPKELPKLADRLRVRFYPFLGTICRDLTRVHLGGALMRGLLKMRWVERSADNKLDPARMIGPLEAQMALRKLKKLKNRPVREFALVKTRDVVLDRLKQAGYYFDGFWYEKPVSPARYYKKVHFPEASCPEAVKITGEIINFPTYCSKAELAPAKKIVAEYLVKEEQK